MERRLTAFVLIFILLLLVYWNSFQVPWQFDDRANIVDNPGLRIDNLKPESLWGAFFANQGKENALWRPLPCLSLALNWYVGKEDPFGYHLVNLAGHILTAWILYLLTIHLLTVLGGNKKDKLLRWSEPVALLAAVLWAANPIQTQAVTYIVQRMAMMAALFYLMGMYFYVKARISKTSGRRWVFAVICCLCFLGGIGSKENAILMPMSLALMEWIFFQQGSLSFLFKPKALLIIAIVFIAGFLTIYFSIGIPFDYILNGYKVRTFTPIERMLTQPRIVLGYLSQIFFPLPERLSLVHDVTLSKSLLQPWTTLPAIAIIFGMIGGAMFYAKRYPLVSFAVLFYFLNHLVESSILPLELVFEHRNYLPSAFLMLPVAAGFFALLIKLKKFGILNAITIAVMAVIIIALGAFTHERNKVWATKESLWRDAMLKAPGDNRPLGYLGIELGWRKHATSDDLRHALVLFKHSLNLTVHHKIDYPRTLGNIALVYSLQDEDKMAVETFQQAITKYPEFHKNRIDIISSLMRLGRFEEAKEQAQFMARNFPDNPKYSNTLGVILLWLGQNEGSLECFQTAIKQDPDNKDNKDSTLYLGVALTRAGHLKRGHWFLNQVVRNSAGYLLPKLALIENRVRAGDINRANSVAMQLVEIMPANGIIKLLEALPQYPSVPVAADLVRPVVLSAMTNIICIEENAVRK